MAYGKKPLKNRTINRSPWSRESQKRPFSGSMRNTMRSANPTGILTGRSQKPEKSVRGAMPQNNTIEKRGGERRAPFLSNTGPGKKGY